MKDVHRQEKGTSTLFNNGCVRFLQFSLFLLNKDNIWSTKEESTSKDKLFLGKSSASGKQHNFKTRESVRPTVTEEEGIYIRVKQS